MYIGAKIWWKNNGFWKSCVKKFLSYDLFKSNKKYIYFFYSVYEIYDSDLPD